MAKEPENLVLEHLRIIRADIKDLRAEMNGEFRDVRGILGEHSRRFDFLEERVEMLREGTLTANRLCGERGRIYEKAGEANRRPDEAGGEVGAGEMKIERQKYRVWRARREAKSA